MELFQLWIMAFCTLALFSFMYKDNPFYRIAEHIFAGLTTGYQVGLIWDSVILQQLWNPMTAGIGNDTAHGNWWLIIPGILGFLMFTRFSKNFSWISRVSLAFVMGVTAGIFIISQLHGLVLPQMQNTMLGATETIGKAEDGFKNNFGELYIIDPDSAIIDFAVTDSIQALDTAFTNLENAKIKDTSAILPTNPSLALGTITPSTLHVNRLGDETVTLRATYIDTLALGMLDYHSPTFKIQKHGDATPEILATASVYSNNGIRITNNGDGTYTAEYDYNPSDDHDIGAYDLGFEIQRQSIMLLLTIVIVLGVLSTLIYFYFSHEHVGLLGVTAKIGIWFIMIAFGAHFGYTVMGRVSLLIGRVQFLINDWIGSIF